MNNSGKEIINITKKEMDKYETINKLLNHKINTNRDASIMLNIGIRQIQRLKLRVEKEGASGVVHLGRNRKSNRSFCFEKEEEIKRLLMSTYKDFGPKLASEKLEELHHIFLSKEKTRQVLIELGLWTVKKRKRNKEYRSWRERRFCLGELLQFDGSYHDWLEDGIERCLLGSIDDATGNILKLELTTDEGCIPVFKYWRDYMLEFGKPKSIYLDKFSTYKVNNNNVMKNDIELKTKFGKIADELDINLVTAHSPQAKGRIERLWRTLQDRLVKEFRLNNIKTVEAANIFMKDIFIPNYNKKFGVIPKSNLNVHVGLSIEEKKNRDHIFSVKEIRQVNNDFTLSLFNQWYQLEKEQKTLVLRKDKVTIEKRIDDSIHLILRDKELNFHEITKQQKVDNKKIKSINKLVALTFVKDTPKKTYKPASNHPWRNQNNAFFRERIRARTFAE